MGPGWFWRPGWCVPRLMTLLASKLRMNTRVPKTCTYVICQATPTSFVSDHLSLLMAVAQTPKPWSFVTGSPYGEYLLMEAAAVPPPPLGCTCHHIGILRARKGDASKSGRCYLRCKFLIRHVRASTHQCSLHGQQDLQADKRPLPASQAQNQTAAVTAAIVEHRETYVTAADFKLLAEAGINSVRLGVGYWVMADTPVR